MLDQVYPCLRLHDSARQGCNVMFYKDDIPNVEIGVELIAPCVLEHRDAVVRGRKADPGGPALGDLRGLAR